MFIPFAGVTQTWDEYTDKTAEGTCAIRDKRHRDSSLFMIRLRRLRKRKCYCRRRKYLPATERISVNAGCWRRWRTGPSLAARISAGARANLACPTIRTTNDMPIVVKRFRRWICSRCSNAHFTNALPEGHKEARPASSVFADFAGGRAGTDSDWFAGR